MFKRVLISGAAVVALSASVNAGGDFKKLEERKAMVAKQAQIENNKKSNVVVRELKDGKPVDTVYSEVKVEYADVKTIERLKRAVVILIEKVESFEKKVDAKEISKNDLHLMQKNLRSDLTHKFGKELDKLSKNTMHNTQAIKSMRKESRSIAKKATPRSSKYDKKIEEFLNKENSVK